MTNPLTIPFETRCLSSLSKVFADSQLNDSPVHSGTTLGNEVFSFQIAYRSQQSMRSVKLHVKSPLASVITLREVGLVPSELPTFENPDSGYLRTTPGLYPDLLKPIADSIRVLPGQWRSIWVTVSSASLSEINANPGANVAPTIMDYPIELCFIGQDETVLGSETLMLTVVPASLPEQKLLHTEWFHCDCIATSYDVEVFSEEHWQWIERFARNAAEHGVNMLLTPLFTPPLDTAVGSERPTVQLIDVEVEAEGRYRFHFSKLTRWIAMCQRVGIRYYEFSHLFTQWGAKHAPKIVATVGGSQMRIFGWETEAAGESYRQFLNQFLPELVKFIREHELDDKAFFHVSDEPSVQHLESYKQASDILKAHLGQYSFIEALSDYAFYEQGLVPTPIPANNHIEPFLANGIEPLWTYYCCSQGQDVSNRFFALPSARNRILGIQLYKFGIKGFLHWGFNFWYSQYSIQPIDPYRVTDAGGGFPSGDAFVVYPGPEGPLDSIRWEVFREALQDLRALELLESLVGKDRVKTMIEEGLEDEISFSKYPSELEWLLQTRKRINLAIHEAILTAR